MPKNNQGWGLREMLFFSGILLLAVIVVAILVNTLYNDLSSSLPNSDDNKTGSTYEQVEENLVNAAKRYYRAHKDEAGDLIVSEDLIAEGYITVQKLTVNNDICDGYVLVDDEVFTPYITCTNYETEGY